MSRDRSAPVVEEEGEGRRESVLALNRVAFGRNDEAELVGRLADDGEVILSLVALPSGAREREDVVGHVLFTRLEVSFGGAPIKAAALAPLCVHPTHRRSGIGSALVAKGLALLAVRGYEAVVVLGDPAYYSRFGFSSRQASALKGPFSGPAFMALELVPGSLAGSDGSVTYPAAFGLGDV